MFAATGSTITQAILSLYSGEKPFYSGEVVKRCIQGEGRECLGYTGTLSDTEGGQDPSRLVRESCRRARGSTLQI